MFTMTKIQKRIEIVRSTRNGLSSMNHKTALGIKAILEGAYETVGITIIDCLADIDKLVAKQPDLAFMGCKYVPKNNGAGTIYGSKIWITDYLEKHGIAYTGSNHAAQEFARDKVRAKDLVTANDIKTSAFHIVGRNQKITANDITLNYPIFVKPPNRGNGAGIDDASFAYDFEALQKKVNELAHEQGSDSLLEEYLPGREFTVAVIGNKNNDDMLVMPLELISEKNEQGHRILGKREKLNDKEQVLLIPDKIIKQSVCDLALNVFHALGASNYGRIDIRMDSMGVPHFLEANLLPGLGGGYFERALKMNQGFDYDTVILRIADVAFGLHPTTNSPDLASQLSEPLESILV